MKTKILTLIFIGCFSLLAITQNEKGIIDDLLTDWHNSAADVNQQAYFDFIDEDGIYIGTDSTEIWTKQEFFEWSQPHFDKQKTWSFKANSRNIYLSDDIQFAWFDELVSYGKGTLRGSGVLVKRTEGWKILHYVLSLPVPNDKFKDVVKVLEDKTDGIPTNGD